MHPGRPLPATGFVDKIWSGALPGPVLRTYLVQDNQFLDAFVALDVPATDRTSPELLAPTAGFLTLMQSARRSADYPTCLAVLLVAEWLYLDWATRPGAGPPHELIQREWIELHRGPDFERWVAFLRAEFDRVTAGLDADRQVHVAATFARAVELELAFFDAAYTG